MEELRKSKICQLKKRLAKFPYGHFQLKSSWHDSFPSDLSLFCIEKAIVKPELIINENIWETLFNFFTRSSFCIFFFFFFEYLLTFLLGEKVKFYLTQFVWSASFLFQILQPLVCKQGTCTSFSHCCAFFPVSPL